jgi:hypothetical protein
MKHLHSALKKIFSGVNCYYIQLPFNLVVREFINIRQSVFLSPDLVVFQVIAKFFVECDESEENLYITRADLNFYVDNMKYCFASEEQSREMINNILGDSNDKHLKLNSLEPSDITLLKVKNIDKFITMMQEIEI